MKNAELIHLFDSIPAQIAVVSKPLGDGSARIATATARLTATNGRLTELRASHASAGAALASVSASVATLKKTHRTPHQRCIDAVAGLGIFPPVAATSNFPGQNREALLVRLARETDPVKKTNIARQLRELSQ